MMKNKIGWLFGLFICFNTEAQNFAYEAEVLPVSTSGFYRITLSSELLGQLQSDYSDIRIYDEDGQEQPYLLRREKAMSITSLFKEHEIIEKAYKKDAISHLIFNNPDKQPINNVSFLVKNTDVQKRARLSGSDDRENWFVIKNNYLLHAMESTDETTELKMLNFPLSDYAYFKLEIDDNWKLPINILKVGYYDTQRAMGMSTAFECPIIGQKDSLKRSYVRLKLPTQMYLEKLRFEVSGADYYSRPVRVLIKKKKEDKKKRMIEYQEVLGSFDLNSNSTNEVSFKGQSVGTLYVEIENRDNAPLKVERVEGSYLNCYLVAKLDPKVKYVLKLGDETLRAPAYDLVAFASQIPEDAPKIGHNEIVDVRIYDAQTHEKGLLDSAYLIWIVIGGVGVILAFVSVKMVREIGHKP